MVEILMIMGFIHFLFNEFILNLQKVLDTLMINKLETAYNNNSLICSLEENPAYPGLMVLSNIFDQYSITAYGFTIDNFI